MYLVRDWTFEFEHSYGFDGGESYLKEFTEVTSVSSILKTRFNAKSSSMKVLIAAFSKFWKTHQGRSFMSK